MKFFGVFFLVDEGREDQNTIIRGYHRPASETPFKWRFAGMPMMAQLSSFMIFQGIPTSIAIRNPIFFCFFSGGDPDPLAPLPLDPRMSWLLIWMYNVFYPVCHLNSW